MAVVHLPRSLIALFPALPRRVEADGATVEAIIDDLDQLAPGLRDRLCTPGSGLRPHINVYVDGSPAQLATPVGPATDVHVIPAVSGGAARDPRPG